MISIYVDESGTEEQGWFAIAMLMTRKRNPDDLLGRALNPLKKVTRQGVREFHAADANWEERRTCLGLLSTIEAYVGYSVCNIPKHSRRRTWAEYVRYLTLAGDLLSDIVLFHPKEEVKLLVDDKFWVRLDFYPDDQGDTRGILPKAQFHDQQIEKFEYQVKLDVNRKLEDVGRGDLESNVNRRLSFTFCGSHTLNGLQLADCVAYTIQWSFSHPGSEEALEALDLITPRLVVEQQPTF